MLSGNNAKLTLLLPPSLAKGIAVYEHCWIEGMHIIILRHALVVNEVSLWCSQYIPKTANIYKIFIGCIC